MRTSRAFDVDLRSIPAARHYVAEAVDRVGVDGDVAELLVSELATNAVEHTGSSFEVAIDIMPRRVRVEVINDEPEFVAAIAAQRAPGEGGLGLRLVETMAARWGTECTESHKTVWFELSVE
jgi:anti-sigma regulatory factor (Ser/Thr protein kinase)